MQVIDDAQLLDSGGAGIKQQVDDLSFWYALNRLIMDNTVSDWFESIKGKPVDQRIAVQFFAGRLVM
jgi:hypothetical protein